MPGRHVRFERSMTCAPAGGESLPICLIRSPSMAMTIFGSSWSDLPSNKAPQRMYTGPGGGAGTSFTGRGALSVSSLMFWANANPDSSANKQSVMESHFSMEATPQKELCWETAEYDKSPPGSRNYRELDCCN